MLLVPDDVRLRQASRALDSLTLLGFLALEGDAARGDATGQVWRTPSGPVPLSLREVLDYVRPGGKCPPGRRLAANPFPHAWTWTPPETRFRPACCPFC